jgi:hypothetical protein
VVATDEQPLIALPAFLNAIFPGVLADAERVTGVPYLAVVTPPGKERIAVGVALLTIILTVAKYGAELAAS